MLKVLEDLIVLQERDRRIHALRRELEDLPNRRALAQQRLEERRRRVSEAEDAWKANAAEIKRLEMDIDSHKEQVARMTAQQFEVKSNEQYRTLLAEIAAHKEKIRQLEDRELELMEAGEARRAALEKARAEFRKDEQEAAETLRAFDAREATLRQELAAEEAARAERAAGIEPDWLSRYERILKHHGDRAIVPIENGACGGCHMKLPPQSAQDARRAQSVVSCGYCGRLLYWKA